MKEDNDKNSFTFEEFTTHILLAKEKEVYVVWENCVDTKADLIHLLKYYGHFCIDHLDNVKIQIQYSTVMDSRKALEAFPEKKLFVFTNNPVVIMGCSNDASFYQIFFDNTIRRIKRLEPRCDYSKFSQQYEK